MLEMGYTSVAAAEFDFEGKIPGGKVSRCCAKIRTKKTSSPWQPPIGAKVSILTINHYSLLEIRLVRTAAWVGAASFENWLISGTSRRSAFFAYPNMIF